MWKLCRGSYFIGAVDGGLFTARITRRVKRCRLIERTYGVVARRLFTVAVQIAVHRQIPPDSRKKIGKKKIKKNTRYAILLQRRATIL